MTQYKQNNQLSFDESVEQYHVRILSMDMELKEMYYDRTISAANFKKRQRHIDLLKFKLEEVRVNWTAQKGNQSVANQNFPLPALKECSPDEQQLCEKTLTERVKTLKSLVNYTNNLTAFIQKSISGRSGSVRLTIELSKLRTNLTQIESQTHDLKHDKKKLDQFISSLSKEEKNTELNIHTRNGAIELFKLFFEKINLSNSNIHQLKIKAQEENERINWMERWLNFQEKKVGNFITDFELPDPILTQRMESSTNDVSEQTLDFESSQYYVDPTYNIKRIRQDLRTAFKSKLKGEPVEFR